MSLSWEKPPAGWDKPPLRWLSTGEHTARAGSVGSVSRVGTPERLTDRAAGSERRGRSLVDRLAPYRTRLHHGLWALFVVALGAVAFGTVGSEEDLVPFLAPMVVAGVWGFLAVAIGIVLDDERRRPGLSGHPATRARQQEERRRRRERRQQRLLHQRGGLRPPWRLPWLPGYLAVAVGLVAAGVAFGGGPDVEDRTTIGLLYPLAVVLGGLIGLGVALLGLVMAIAVMGIVGFGRIVVTGRAGDEPVDRLLALGPFVATSGLLLLPFVLAGATAYDSPYRRDVGPLVGWVREGVEVTHPTLLLLAQVASWVLLTCAGTGFVVHRWAVSRSGPAGAEDRPSA